MTIKLIFYIKLPRLTKIQGKRKSSNKNYYQLSYVYFN